MANDPGESSLRLDSKSGHFWQLASQVSSDFFLGFWRFGNFEIGTRDDDGGLLSAAKFLVHNSSGCGVVNQGVR